MISTLKIMENYNLVIHKTVCWFDKSCSVCNIECQGIDISKYNDQCYDFKRVWIYQEVNEAVLELALE